MSNSQENQESFALMDGIDSKIYVECLLEQSPNDQLSSFTSIDHRLQYDSNKLNSAVWTTHGTSMLLKLYESKLEMLETPKKKTRIWIAISDSLRDYDIEVSPDQVRWKINALTKKYKRCINMGTHDTFKYFKEMNIIYEKYDVDCDSYSISEFLSKNKLNTKNASDSTSSKLVPEPRAVIQMRKSRLAKRIFSDRFQGKIKLERQLLEYLRKQEAQNQWDDTIMDRNLKIKQEKLEIRKREMELKESLEYKKIQLMEKEHTELLQIEKAKCELLKQMLDNRI